MTAQQRSTVLMVTTLSQWWPSRLQNRSSRTDCNCHSWLRPRKKILSPFNVAQIRSLGQRCGEDQRGKGMEGEGREGKGPQGLVDTPHVPNPGKYPAVVGRGKYRTRHWRTTITGVDNDGPDTDVQVVRVDRDGPYYVTTTFNVRKCRSVNVHVCSFWYVFVRSVNVHPCYLVIILII